MEWPLAIGQGEDAAGGAQRSTGRLKPVGQYQSVALVIGNVAQVLDAIVVDKAENATGRQCLQRNERGDGEADEGRAQMHGR